MYQRIVAEGCFVRVVRKYIEKKRKVVGEANMILKESDLRHLVRGVLVESKELANIMKYLDEYMSKNPGANILDFRKHLEDTMSGVSGNKDDGRFSRSVELEDEDEEYRYWRSDLKSYFKGRPWVKVSLEEVEPTLDFFDERREDTSYYRRDIEKAGYAWIRFVGASVKGGKRCAVFEVRIYGARGQYRMPRHGGNVRLYHYIDIEELGDKIRYLNGSPIRLRLEEKSLRYSIRKVIFESEGAIPRVKAKDVEVVFPDDIDRDLLEKGDQDKEISGFAIKRDKEDREIEQVRAGIYFRGGLVGFMTPREEKGGWRVGAIYVDGEVRKKFKGIGGIAIAKFFEGREAADLLIGVDNIASQRAFSKAGFKNTGKTYKDDSDGWEATWWSNKK